MNKLRAERKSATLRPVPYCHANHRADELLIKALEPNVTIRPGLEPLSECATPSVDQKLMRVLTRACCIVYVSGRGYQSVKAQSELAKPKEETPVPRTDIVFLCSYTAQACLKPPAAPFARTSTSTNYCSWHRSPSFSEQAHAFN